MKILKKILIRLLRKLLLYLLRKEKIMDITTLVTSYQSKYMTKNYGNISYNTLKSLKGKHVKIKDNFGNGNFECILYKNKLNGQYEENEFNDDSEKYDLSDSLFEYDVNKFVYHYKHCFIELIKDLIFPTNYTTANVYVKHFITIQQQLIDIFKSNELSNELLEVNNLFNYIIDCICTETNISIDNKTLGYILSERGLQTLKK